MVNNTKAVSLEGAGRSSQTYIIVTAFLSLLAIVGFAYYGPPFFFNFMIKDFGWSRTIVTSGNALAKFLIGPLFGFVAGYLIDRYGPRLMLMAGALMGGFALAAASAGGLNRSIYQKLAAWDQKNLNQEAPDGAYWDFITSQYMFEPGLIMMNNGTAGVE